MIKRMGSILIPFVLSVLIVRFSSPARVVVSWKTASEVDAAGFRLYRSETPAGPFELLSPDLILATGDPLVGDDYTFIDTDVTWGTRYYYQLEEINLSGTASRYEQIVSARAGLGWGWAIGIGVLLSAFSLLLTKFPTAKTSSAPTQHTTTDLDAG